VKKKIKGKIKFYYQLKFQFQLTSKITFLEIFLFFRSGRIAIKEGDNLKTLASNFCKAYSLTKDVEDSLVE
jgi:hypothetical protein